MRCPCGREADYKNCCQLLHRGIAKATGAEQLMRSRYSAFAMNEYQYLIETHHPDTRGSMSLSTLADSNRGTKWLCLQILSTTNKTVNFRAYFQSPVSQKGTPLQYEKIDVLHENSRFLVEGNRWYYFDGDHDPLLAVLPARKDPCFCDSGKKFKNCHGV